MKRPILILLSDFHRPIDVQRARLREIEAQLSDATSDSICLQGLFVLAISGFETMLSDIYKYFLEQVPAAYDFKEAKFTRTMITEAATSFELLRDEIERHVISLGYERFIEILRKVSEALAIANPSFDAALLERIVEEKETRNALLHSNLRVTRAYLTKAGPKRRPTPLGNTLPLTKPYIQDTVADVSALVDEISARIRTKYQAYTKIRALRELWSYLFSSPIMKCEDYWTFDEPADKVVALKISAWEQRLSGSEKQFLAVLRVHFNAFTETTAPVYMIGLDSENQRKMMYLLELLADFRPW